VAPIGRELDQNGTEIPARINFGGAAEVSMPIRSPLFEPLLIDYLTGF
jgi:hypothetical protein